MPTAKRKRFAEAALRGIAKAAAPLVVDSGTRDLLAASDARGEPRPAGMAGALPRIDDVLKARGLKHVGFIEHGGVITDVNHKPVK